MFSVDLSNKNILVTGASDGIGKEIARMLIENGARVAVHYNKNRDSAAQLASQDATGGSAIFQADLAETHEVLKLWDAVSGRYGRIDSIVLNAGVYLEQKISENDSDWLSTWSRTLSINLDAPGLLTKKGVEHFRAHGGGRFVYIASRAAFRGETEEYLGYAASKGGLVSLGRTVARSFGKYDIKSFVVAPGFVKTAMADQFIETYGRQRIIDELALNELTGPKDLSPLVALMCSGLMDHATGATIDVNAGSHIR